MQIDIHLAPLNLRSGLRGATFFVRVTKNLQKMSALAALASNTDL